MSAELGAVSAAAPVPLLTAQVRVVENKGESSPPAPNAHAAQCGWLSGHRRNIAFARSLACISLAKGLVLVCAECTPLFFGGRWVLKFRVNRPRSSLKCIVRSSNCDDRRCVTCWRWPSSFSRIHSGSASERVTAAASPRYVPAKYRKLTRKSGRDHPSLRHAQLQKLVCSNCDATCTIGSLIGSNDSYDEVGRNFG